MPAGFVLPCCPFRTNTPLFQFLGTVQRLWSPTRLGSLFPSSSLPWGFHAGATADPCGLWPVAGSSLRLGGGEDKMSVWPGPATALTVPCHAIVT